MTKGSKRGGKGRPVKSWQNTGSRLDGGCINKGPLSCTFDEDCESDIVPKLNLCPPTKSEVFMECCKVEEVQEVDDVALGDQTSDHP